MPHSHLSDLYFKQQSAILEQMDEGTDELQLNVIAAHKKQQHRIRNNKKNCVDWNIFKFWITIYSFIVTKTKKKARKIWNRRRFKAAVAAAAATKYIMRAPNTANIHKKFSFCFLIEAPIWIQNFIKFLKCLNLNRKSKCRFSFLLSFSCAILFHAEQKNKRRQGILYYNHLL